jgi:hypothetical protein
MLCHVCALQVASGENLLVMNAGMEAAAVEGGELSCDDDGDGAARLSASSASFDTRVILAHEENVSGLKTSGGCLLNSQGGIMMCA